MRRLRLLLEPRHPVAAWTAVGVAVVVAVSGSYVVDLVTDRHDAVVEASVTQARASIRGVLESELNGTIHLGDGLVGLIAYDPELSGVEDGRGPIVDALREVHRAGDHVRNLGLAPDNVIRAVYPLEGNEQALGLRYEDVPAQWPEVQLTIERRTSLLVGPIDLVQGGRGLINRTPVFLSDGVYWGQISLVIDPDSLVDAVDEAIGVAPVEWAVRSSSPIDGQRRAVTGDQDLFSSDAPIDGLDVEGATWQLVAVADPTALGDGPPIAVLRGLVALAALALAALVFVTIVQNGRFRALSLRDPLTGLPNRRLLMDRLQQALDASVRSQVGCALLVLDLDGFKQLNDTLGHEAGDDALRETAARLSALVRGADTVARLGGDEFVVVLPDTGLATAADVIAARVQERLTYVVPGGRDGRDCPMGVTVGVAHAPTNATDPAQLLRVADAAMYRGKLTGGGRTCVAVEGVDEGGPRHAQPAEEETPTSVEV